MSSGFTLGELAAASQTQVQGDSSKVIYAVAAVATAGPRDISFVRDSQYARYLENTNAGALILPADLAENYAGDCLVSPNPYLSYARIVTLMNPVVTPEPGIDPAASIADGAEIGEAVYIGPNVVVESGVKIGRGSVIQAGCVIGRNSSIGENNLFHPNVTLYSDTVTGDRVILHSGVVLGADGFGFVPDPPTGWYKIPQIGRVVLEDDVEIGANTTIDRAAMGDTHLGRGVKLDNLIHIAHNVQLGEHTVIAACTGIAGSARIGKRCQISGMVSIAGHLTIADDTTITATSFVTNSITRSGVYSSGTTVDEHGMWRKNAVRFRQLDQLSRRVKALEQALAALQNSD